MFKEWTANATDPAQQDLNTQTITSAVSYIVQMMQANNLTTAQVESMLRKYAAKYPGMPSTIEELKAYYMNND
jgi:phage-related minor tail protein